MHSYNFLYIQIDRKKPILCLLVTIMSEHFITEGHLSKLVLTSSCVSKIRELDSAFQTEFIF